MKKLLTANAVLPKGARAEGEIQRFFMADVEKSAKKTKLNQIHIFKPTIKDDAGFQLGGVPSIFWQPGKLAAFL